MRVLLVGLVLAILAVPSPIQAVEGPQPEAADDFGPRQAVLQTPWFTFYSHFGFNLYDAVLASATERRAQRADPVQDGACFASLVQEERSAWDAAVAYYAETVAATSDFSRERAIVRAHLTGIEIDLDDDDRRDLGLSLLFLRAAAPAWRACRWEEQDAVNRRWIAELSPRLERHADDVGARLEKLFARSWRRRPIAVDVVTTAGWAGADTSVFDDATHIRISSRNPGYQGSAALEMIFHEASHELVSPRNGPIAQLLASASAETGVPVHQSLWHGLLFVTVGEVAREVLARAGEDSYKPFADGVFRGDWEVLYRPLVEHWLPFVRGETDREKAARGLMTALGGTGASAPPPVRVDVKTGPAAEAIHADLARRVPDGFGGAILVEREGAVVLRGGYGWADRERRVPFTTSTIAQVGSLTKQFTAAAIVDLSSRGKLAFSDPLKRHLEGVPAPAAEITIHQLLTHTAGLTTDCGGDFERVTRSELITRCLARLDRPPGSKFVYSNLGFSALAAIVEIVSGKSVEDYLAERFFQPLGMARTGYFFGDPLRGSLATGYTAAGAQPPISDRIRPLSPDFWNLKGNGGMQASVEDMYVWYRALARGPVLTDAMRRTLTTPHARRDDGVGYGYGWFVRTRPDGTNGEVEQVSHTGSDGVFFSAFVWRPLERTFYYFVTNTGEKGGAEIASQVLRILTAGPPVEKRPAGP